MCHGVWDVAALFSSGLVAGLHRAAKDVLADPAADDAGLFGPHARDQSLAAAEEMDLILILIMKARRMHQRLTGRMLWGRLVTCGRLAIGPSSEACLATGRLPIGRRLTIFPTRVQWFVFALLFLFVGLTRRSP